MGISAQLLELGVGEDYFNKGYQVNSGWGGVGAVLG